MSRIVDALKKVQKEKERVAYLDFTPVMKEARPEMTPIKITPMIMIITGIILALLIILGTFIKIEFTNGELQKLTYANTIQQQKIDNLGLQILQIKNAKKSSDAQIQNLNNHLNETSKEFKIKMYSLSVTTNENYAKANKSIGGIKTQLDLLTKDVNKIRKKMEEISILNEQNKI